MEGGFGRIYESPRRSLNSKLPEAIIDSEKKIKGEFIDQNRRRSKTLSKTVIDINLDESRKK